MKQILYIYTRVSTRVQDTEGTSLDTQKEIGIKKAAELGFKYKVGNDSLLETHNYRNTYCINL